MEKALEKQEIALGFFLDVEGAFNYISFDSVCVALIGRGVSSTIVWWLKATLEGRQATAALNDTFIRVAVSKGSPQGGMFSSLLWCLFDYLIARLIVGGVYCQGYADDICLLAVGKFPNTMSELIQRAIHTVET
jgi:hypothetical protein